MLRFNQWLSQAHPDFYGEAEIAKDVERAHEEPGGSNVGKERETSGAREGPFCGPSGGAPKGSYPVTSAKQGRAAKAYSRNAPNPEGIKSCVDRVLGKKSSE
jgi:hypothetical protein